MITICRPPPEFRSAARRGLRHGAVCPLARSVGDAPEQHGIDDDQVLVLIDGVDDPVGGPARGPLTVEGLAQRLAGPTPGLLRAVARGVVPLPLGGARRLAGCRCLLCLLTGQAALTPSADPPGKPGLHHAHLPLFMEESWRARPAASLLCLRIPACDAADVSVQAHPRSRAYARAVKPALSHRSHCHDLGAVRALAGAIALAGAGVTVVAVAIRRRLWSLAR